MARNEQDLFFFSQTDLRKKTHRTKKQLDEQTLNNIAKKIQSKFQISEEEQLQGLKRSLTDRLADLYKVNSGNASQSGGLGSATSSASGSRNSALAPTPPQAFTDTRLQAIRFLTEDLIRELEETLFTYFDTQTQPVLPGAIIYELHNDWADLTDGVTYRNFPVWQTRAARDALLKRTPNVGTLGKNVSRISHVTDASRQTKDDHEKVKKQTRATKLSAISETRSKNVVSINNVTEQIVMKTTRTMSTTRKASAAPQKAQLEMIASRLANNNSLTGSAVGCLVNYQLSNNQFKDKGWTVVVQDTKEDSSDVERRIFFFLNTSMRSM